MCYLIVGEKKKVPPQRLFEPAATAHYRALSLRKSSSRLLAKARRAHVPLLPLPVLLVFATAKTGTPTGPGSKTSLVYKAVFCTPLYFSAKSGSRPSGVLFASAANSPRKGGYIRQHRACLSPCDLSHTQQQSRVNARLRRS